MKNSAGQSVGQEVNGRTISPESGDADSTLDVPESLLRLLIDLTESDDEHKQAEIELDNADAKLAEHALHRLRDVLQWPNDWTDTLVTQPSWIWGAWKLLDGGVRRLSESIKMVKAEIALAMSPPEFANLFAVAATRGHDRDTDVNPELVGAAECSELGLRIVCTRTQTYSGFNLMVKVAKLDGSPVTGVQISVKGNKSGDSTQATDADGAVHVGIVDELLEVRVVIRDERTAQRQALIVTIEPSGS